MKLENITKTFKNGCGVKGVSFEIKKGDLIGLIGPNGAGKTTLMKSIFGEIIIQEGKITLEEDEVMSFFPDSNNIPLNMKVKEYVEYIGVLNNISPEEIKTSSEKLYHIFNYQDNANKYLKELSAGLKKIAILIGALIIKPNILFLDEPTANLDLESKIDFMNIIKKLIDLGITIVFTTHLFEEIKGLINRVIILAHGEIQLDQKVDKNTNLEEIYKAITNKEALNLQEFNEFWGDNKNEKL